MLLSSLPDPDGQRKQAPGNPSAPSAPVGLHGWSAKKIPMRRRPHRAHGPPPTFEEEARLLTRGYSLVAGLDEVGRGPIAGPVVAGVTALPPDLRADWADRIRDSKQMTAAQREEVFPHILDGALVVGTGMSSPREIDERGIVGATRLAMQRALESLPLLPQFLLLDAFPLPNVPIAQKAIVHGDSLCLSIAAASIVAKVTRDRMMEDEDAAYPGYGFGEHKGYCTREHLRNLRRLGPCPIHRYSFAPVKEWARER